jgi:hypothetical protein
MAVRGPGAAEPVEERTAQRKTAQHGGDTDRGDAEDREIRAAAKFLLVALESFRRHGGPSWRRLVEEYLTLVDENPEKFDRIIKCQRYPGRPQRSD